MSSSPKQQKEESSISVSCRVRPFSAREIEISSAANEGRSEWERKPLRAVVDFNGGECLFHTDASDDVGAGSQVHERTEKFTFDNCFWTVPTEESRNGFAGQLEVFNTLGLAVLDNAFAGKNTGLMMYGQTGAGKSYSMMGTPEDPGIIPRLGRRLFEMIAEKSAEMDRQNQAAAAAAAEESGGSGAAAAAAAASAAAAGGGGGGGGGAHSKNYTVQVTVRYLEIYNEMVKDLLWNMSTLPPDVKAKTNPENLRVRSSPQTGVFVENLTGVVVESVERMLEIIEQGNSSRTVAATKMNERSSRSHAIFKVEVRQMTAVHSGKQFEKPTEHIREATINLVDLAGSERNKKTGATGDRLKEAANINKSLSCLKNVIDVLVDNMHLKPDRRKKPPYRDSTLTSLLADSLGGNSKTYMLVCLSPHTDNAEETLQTLKYGSKARQIVTTVSVNENAAGRLLLDMEEQLQKLRDQQNQLSFAQTAEGIAKMEVMKADIDEKTQMHNFLEAQRQKSERTTGDMCDELAQLQRGNQRRALANMQRAYGPDVAARAEQARRYRECEKRYDACRDELSAHKARLAEGEFSVSQLENMIEANRAALDTSEVELDVVRRRNSKMDVSRRELVRNVQEQEQELTRLVHLRMTTVMASKARCLRLRAEHRAFLAQLQRDHERAKVDLLEQHRRNVDAERAQTSRELREAQHRADELQKRREALQLQAERVIAERQAQVEHLERDLDALQRESERLRALGEKRLRHSKEDWDTRDERGRQKTEATLEQLRDAHRADYDRAVGHQVEKEARSRAKWAEEDAENLRRIERMLADAEQARRAQVQRIEDELGPALNEELRKCKQTVAALRDVLRQEDEFALLAHAIAVNWSQFPQLKEAEASAEREGLSRSTSAVSSPRLLGGGDDNSSRGSRSTSAAPEQPTFRSASTASGVAGSSAAAPPVLGRRATANSARNVNSNAAAGKEQQQQPATAQTLAQLARASSPSPPPPRSFFGQLVEFSRGRELNQPCRYQITQIIQTAERLMGGATDVSSVVPPVRL